MLLSIEYTVCARRGRGRNDNNSTKIHGLESYCLITVEANNSPDGCGKLTSCAPWISLSEILSNQSGHPLNPWTRDLVFFSPGNILHQQWTKETGGRGVRQPFLTQVIQSISCSAVNYQSTYAKSRQHMLIHLTSITCLVQSSIPYVVHNHTAWLVLHYILHSTEMFLSVYIFMYNQYCRSTKEDIVLYIQVEKNLVIFWIFAIFFLNIVLNFCKHLPVNASRLVKCL